MLKPRKRRPKGSNSAVPASSCGTMESWLSFPCSFQLRFLTSAFSRGYATPHLDVMPETTLCSRLLSLTPNCTTRHALCAAAAHPARLSRSLPHGTLYAWLSVNGDG